jgi:hypothetical protein
MQIYFDLFLFASKSVDLTADNQSKLKSLLNKALDISLDQPHS